MKKALSLLIVLCVMAMMLPVLAEETDVTGTWYLTELTMEGEEGNLAEMGFLQVLELNADGTCSITTSYGGEVAEEEEGTWTIDENMVVTINYGEDSGMGLIAVEDRLMWLSDSLNIVFGREPLTPAELANAVAAESEEAFYGTWTLTQLATNGTVIPAETVGIEITAEIEAGKATLRSTGTDEPIRYEYTFADGQLSITDDAGAAIVVLLLDDGSICFDDSEYVMYFVKVE